MNQAFNSVKALLAIGAVMSGVAVQGISSPPSPAAIVFYVAPDGDDSWSGTQKDAVRDDGPFASLQRAQMAVREKVAEGTSEDITVFLRGGRYEIEQPLIFTTRDSGSETVSVNWSAYPGELPVISGGKVVGGWKKTEGDLWKADLSGAENPPWFRDLFADGQRMTRARYPNKDEEALRVETVPDASVAENSEYKLTGAIPSGSLAAKDTEMVMYQVWSLSRANVVSGGTDGAPGGNRALRYAVEATVNTDANQAGLRPADPIPVSPGSNVTLSLDLKRIGAGQADFRWVVFEQDSQGRTIGSPTTFNTGWASITESYTTATTNLTLNEATTQFKFQFRLVPQGNWKDATVELDNIQVVPESGTNIMPNGTFEGAAPGTTVTMTKAGPPDASPVAGWNLYQANPPHPLTNSATIVSAQHSRVTTRHPMGWIGHELTSAAPGRRVYLEHAPQFIDEPGEWYYDRTNRELLFLSEAGGNPNDREFIVPVSDKLLIVRGEKGNPVRNLHFNGLRFEHTAWDLPMNGYSGIQAGHYGSKYIEEPTFALPSAIELQYLEESSFRDCRLAHTGASGLAFGAGCRDNQVSRCEFFDIGGNGIMVGWRPRADDPPRRLFESDWQDASDAPQRIDISDNILRRCGAVQKDCVAIFVAFASDVSVEHNLIEDMPYSGISLGFIWNDRPTSMKRCTVAHNHIHHIMQEMFDGGGIYTLGYQPGTVVHHNYIHDVPRGHGLYTDEGSRGILFENNVVFRVGGWGYQHHHGSDNTLRNNIISAVGRNYIVRSKEDPAESFTFERNIVLMDVGEYLKKADWFSEALFEEFARHWPGEDGTLLSGQWTNGKFRMDYNTYWSLDGKQPEFAGKSLAEWQKAGHDPHSLVADPKLADPMNGDFTPAEDSPARELGFQPIDLSRVGPRPTPPNEDVDNN
jgi:hypothetical protein